MTLLPASATELERTLEETLAVAVGYDLRQLWNADACPVDLLPYLAWALSVDVWENTWSEFQKRETIKRSISLHRLKGTAGAVETALVPFGAVVQMTEWFDSVPPGDPFTFSIDVIAGSGIDAETTEQVVSAVLACKPVSRHFTLRAAVVALGGAYLGGNIFTNGFQHSLIEASN